MKTLIVSNGNIVSSTKLRTILSDCDYIICADGGARHLLELNVKPDILLGDLDSIDDKSYKSMINQNIRLLKFPSKKDKTDTELAIEHAIEMGSKEIILTGVTGTRLDHTLGNIMLLWRLLNKGIFARIIDDNNEIFIVNKSITLNKEEGTYISLIPLTDTLKGVCLKGFEYNIKDGILERISTMAISNEITDKKGYIKIDEGVSLVIKSRD